MFDPLHLQSYLFRRYVWTQTKRRYDWRPDLEWSGKCLKYWGGDSLEKIRTIGEIPLKRPDLENVDGEPGIPLKARESLRCRSSRLRSLQTRACSCDHPSLILADPRLSNHPGFHRGEAFWYTMLPQCSGHVITYPPHHPPPLHSELGRKKKSPRGPGHPGEHG